MSGNKQILPVWLAPKIRCDAGLWPECWRATEKPESDAGYIDLSVGGQQKNQSFKKGDERHCGASVSLSYLLSYG